MIFSKPRFFNYLIIIIIIGRKKEKKKLTYIKKKGSGLFNKGRYRQVISEAFPEITFDEQWLQGSAVPCK